MQSDIRQIILASQDIVDNGVATVAATRQTQTVLQHNINTTNEKISIHNTSDEAHPDIRGRITNIEIPFLIKAPEVIGPSTIESGTSYTWTISTTTLRGGVTVNYFRITDNHGDVWNVNASFSENVYSATLTHAFTGNKNEQTQFTVRAYGNNGEIASETTTYPLFITKHTAPNMANLSHTFPAIINAGSSYNFTISGITDVDDDLSDISISYDATKITPTASTNLTQGSTYSFTVAAGAKGPGTTNVTITATDDFGLTSSVVVPMTLNAWPSTAGVTHNVPLYLNPNSTVGVSFNGITDADTSDTVQLAIASSIPGITFSKASNISVGETFNIIVGDVAPGTAYTLTLTATDGYGASATYAISSTINNAPVMTDFVATKASKYAPGASGTVSFAGASDPENQNITYSVTNNNNTITFSKLTGIAANEEITVSISNAAVRGNTYNVQVTATDASGASSTTTVPFTINQAPSASAVVCGLDTVLKPNTVYTTSFSGGTNADGDSLTYTITSSDATITGGNAVAAGTNVTIQTPDTSAVARGSTWSLTVTVSDGVESDSKTFTYTQNTLPVVTNLTMTQSVARLRVDDSGTVSFAGATDVDGSVSYTIDQSNTGVTFSKTSGIVDNEAVTVTLNDSVTPGSTLPITVRAIDGAGEYVTKNFNLVVNTAPTAPATVAFTPAHPIAGQDATLKISGASDADGDSFTYEIINSNAALTFSKTSGIINNETITMTQASTVQAGDTFNITVLTRDSNNETTSRQVTITINNPPSLASFVCSMPSRIAIGSTANISFSGASDAQDGTLTYDIIARDSVLSFSKQLGIAENEAITMTVSGDALRGASYDFTVRVTDSDGQSATTTVTVHTNALPVLSALSFTGLGTNGYTAPGQTYANCQVSGATDTDGQTLHYTITSSEATISGGSNITAGTAFSITAPSSSAKARGSSYTVRVTVSDGVESVYQDYTFTQNTLPVVSNVILEGLGLGSKVAPNTSYPECQVSGATDADGQTLLYTITSDKATITGGSNITANTDFTIQTPTTSAVARGSSFNITVSVTDGVETVTKVFTYAQNQLPVVTGVTLNGFGLNGFTIPNTAHNSCTVSGALDADGQTLTYTVTSAKATITGASGIAAGANFGITSPTESSVARGSSYTIRVTVSDGLESVYKDFTITQNRVPVASNAAITGIATTVKTIPGQLYTCSISGGTDADNQALTYTITSDKATITGGNNIAGGSSFGITAPAAATVARGSQWSLTITVSDGLESATRTLTYTQNQLPVISGVTLTGVGVNGRTKPGASFTNAKVSGATEPDGQTLSYTITSSKATITNGTSIAANTAFTVVAPSTSAVARGSSYTILVAVTDGLETVTKEFTFTQNQIPTMASAGLSISSMNSGTTVSAQITPATDDGNITGYSISATGLTFSQSSDLAANTNFSITAATVTTNTDRTVTITATDDCGETNTKQVTLTVVAVPKTSTPSISAPTADQQVSVPVVMSWSAYAVYYQ